MAVNSDCVMVHMPLSPFAVEEIKHLWGRKEPWTLPEMNILQQPPLLQSALMAEVNHGLAAIERRGRPATAEDGCFCQVDSLKKREEDLSGPKKRSRRRRLHLKAKVQKRPFLNTLDTLEFVPGCGHHFHSRCLKQLRKVHLGEVDSDVLCAVCRHPAPFTCRTDVIIHRDDALLYYQMTCLKRMATPCRYVSSRAMCPEQWKCRFSHFVEGALVQQGQPFRHAKEKVQETYDLEDWSYDGDFAPPPVPVVPRLTRSGRYARPDGVKGSGRRAMIDTTTGRVVWILENDAILDRLSGAHRYAQPPPKSRR